MSRHARSWSHAGRNHRGGGAQIQAACQKHGQLCSKQEVGASDTPAPDAWFAKISFFPPVDRGNTRLIG